eukprot:6207467-Pleurochrysis_carterae.AAC.2
MSDSNALDASYRDLGSIAMQAPGCFWTSGANQVVIKGPGIQNQVVPGLSWYASGALGCVASFMPPTLLFKVLLAYSPPCPEGVGYPVAKAKQGGGVLLKSNATKWFSEGVRRVVLALDVLGLDGAVGNQLTDLELAAVDVL